MEPIVFHCSKIKTDNKGNELISLKTKRFVKDTPTHTLAFEKKDNNVYMGWSAAHKKDNFNKKHGYKIATERLNVIKNYSAFDDHLFITVEKDNLKTHLPLKVIDNLNYYISKLFKENEIKEDITVYFKSPVNHVCYTIDKDDLIKHKQEIKKFNIDKYKTLSESTNHKDIFAIKDSTIYTANRNDFYETGKYETYDSFISDKIIPVIEEMTENGYSYDFNLELNL